MSASERVPDDDRATELRQEQAVVDALYEALAQQHDRAAQRLAEIRLSPSGGTFQAQSERDAMAHGFEAELARLHIGDLPVCFGRMDLTTGEEVHVGRIGITGDDLEVLLVDWRAPFSQPFYVATPHDPQGLRRRRHLIAKGRRVISIDDDVFDPELLASGHAVRGDGALLSAISRVRTGRMGDIVATIQAEQDRIIRSPLQGVLVVEGGPGTGKTVVALHRAAYLLYTHRARLGASGVLVVGPSPVFLRYIEQVLPSLGETGVVAATTAELLPGIRATGREPDAVAALKGDRRMVAVIEQAVADRQRVPRADLTVAFEGSRLVLDRALARRARRIGRASGLAHNEARARVERVLLSALGQAVTGFLADRADYEVDDDERRRIHRSLARTPDFLVAMERIWPLLTPQQLLNDLFGSPGLLRRATASLAPEEGLLFARDRAADPADVAWSAADIALLDEAAERLGPIPSGTSGVERAAKAQRARDLEFAAGLMDELARPDGREASALDIPMTAEDLAQRYRDEGAGPAVSALARHDRTWGYGHVIVDEAQELTEMAWRMVFRRAPNRSMTIVGDLAQASVVHGIASWADLIEEFAPDRGRVMGLSINYRTPAETMVVADRLAAVAAPGAPTSTAVRSSGRPPRYVATDPAGVTAAVVANVVEQVAAGSDERVAVITAAGGVDAFRAAIDAELPGVAAAGVGALDARVAVLSVEQSKGLEFDVVIIVEPAEVIARSPRGHSDLYVAFTRATQEVIVVHGEALPPALAPPPPPSSS